MTKSMSPGFRLIFLLTGRYLCIWGVSIVVTPIAGWFIVKIHVTRVSIDISSDGEISLYLGRFHSGHPNSWLVYSQKSQSASHKPALNQPFHLQSNKWMMTGGASISGNLPCQDQFRPLRSTSVEKWSTDCGKKSSPNIATLQWHQCHLAPENPWNPMIFWR